MSNPNAPPAPQGLPSLSNLIKPDQISKLTYLSEQIRVQYDNGIRKLWEQINNQPQNSEPYQIAFKKLVDVTNQVRGIMKKYQADQGVHGAQSDTSRPSGQGQQDFRQYAQVNPTGAHPQGMEFSQKVLQQVRAQQFRVPPGIRVLGHERTAKWLQESKFRYATNLQRFETATLKLRELGHDYTTRRSTGDKFSPEEAAAFSNRKSQLDRSIQESKDYIQKWHMTQDELLGSNSGNPSYSEDQALSVEQSHVPPLTQQKSTADQGQPHTINSALEAARSLIVPGGRPASSASTPAQAGYSNSNKVENLQHPGNHEQHPGSRDQQSNSYTTPILSSGPSSQSQTLNTQSGSTPQSSTLQSVRPLSHKAAMAEAAHSYSQPNYQQSAPQSSAHGHPQIGGNQDQPRTGSLQQSSGNIKMPIPKDLKVTAPQQVSMGPARPTLSGGPTNGAMGPMGQPAIQKHPGYVLEGDGERVLSKKKLEELVRQVTGGSGGEIEEGETLSAEVEEVRSLLPNLI